MEPDFQIIIKGVQSELANNIGNAIFEVMAVFEQEDQIDFRRLHRIIVTTDLPKELEELSGNTASGNPITYTEEEYAIGVAKVLILPCENEFEILLIINANVTAALVPEEPEGYQTKNFRGALHLLHHELCHIHDANKKLDALNDVMLKQRYIGKDIFIRPLAEICWSEYIANYLSSSTADDHSLKSMTDMLSDAIGRTKQSIDSEIYSYRYHGDLGRLMDLFQRHGEFLAKTAAYTLGYIDGLDKKLQELSIEAHDQLSDSYFQPVWNLMQKALRNMRASYPDGWTGSDIFDELACAIEDYYAIMGLILSTTKDGRAYVDIPFNPETTPPLIS